MISFNRRFLPPLQPARVWLDGVRNERPPRLVVARMLRHQRHEPNFVVSTGIHVTDTVISLLGNPRRVTSAKLPAEPGSAPLFTARLQFAQGAESVILFAPAVGRLEETYEILGRDYSIRIDALNSRLVIHDRDQVVLEWAPPAEASAAFKGGSVGETAAFIRAVAAGGGFQPDLRQGLTAILVAEAIEAGGTVSFGDQPEWR
jgi:predicted dehydrogenase